jgi:spore coat-associated protein N
VKLPGRIAAVVAASSRTRTRGRLASAIARATLAAGATASLALALNAPAARPEARLQLADGTLSQSNPLGGAAILSAHDMRPGDVATGSVTIANTGSVAGDFSLSSFDVTDVPGRRGGLLSGVLSATVRDVTDPAAPRQVYAGPLGSMPVRQLGALAPGERRTYSFAVALPAAVSRLDDVQGASVSVGYRWRAVTATTVPASPPPTAPTTPATPPATIPATPPATTPVTPPPPPALAPALKLTGKRSWSARGRTSPSVVATCARPCTLRAAVRTLGAPRGLRLKVRSKTLRAAAPPSHRFTIVLSRSARRALALRAAKLRYVAIVVRVTASDAGGLSTTRTKTIRVKR